MVPVWEDEVPRRIHAYKLLAENGKPEQAAQFRRFIEVNFGLLPPEPGQNLREYRLARGQLCKPPKKAEYPITAALWNIMGFQPIIAQSTLRSLCGQDALDQAKDLKISPYGAYQATAKGIRMILRYIRN